jgi:hypothetical protein
LHQPLTDFPRADAYDRILAQIRLGRASEYLDGQGPLLDRRAFPGQRPVADVFQELPGPLAPLEGGADNDTFQFPQNFGGGGGR